MPEVVVVTPETGPIAPVVAESKPVVVNADPLALPSDADPVEAAPVADPAVPPVAEFAMPEKFKGKTAEEIAKSYMELEKHKGVPPVADPNAPPVAADGPKIPVTADQQAAVDVVTAAGLKFDDLNKQFADTGTLDDKSYAALATKGFPKVMVDSYIAGQIALGKAVATRTESAAHTAAGGPEKYAEMVQWAAKGGLDKPGIIAFNRAIDSNDVSAISLAVNGVAAAFTKAGGSEPANITPGSKGKGASVYSSTAQVMKDMNDPRYATDANFRKLVEAKVGRSNVL